MANNYMGNYPNGTSNGNPGNNFYSQPPNPYGNPDAYNVVRAQPLPNNYMPQPQPQVQPQDNGGIYGRFISNAEEITPGEIPMNGNISIFPMVDGSCIFTKKWTNGIINTGLYVPYVPQHPQEQTQAQNNNSNNNEDMMGMILQQLNKIEKMVSKNNQYKKPYNKNKNQGQQGAKEK